VGQLELKKKKGGRGREQKRGYWQRNCQGLYERGPSKGNTLSKSEVHRTSGCNGTACVDKKGSRESGPKWQTIGREEVRMLGRRSEGKIERDGKQRGKATGKEGDTCQARERTPTSKMAASYWDRVKTPTKQQKRRESGGRVGGEKGTKNLCNVQEEGGTFEGRGFHLPTVCKAKIGGYKDLDS